MNGSPELNDTLAALDEAMRPYTATPADAARTLDQLIASLPDRQVSTDELRVALSAADERDQAVIDELRAAIAAEHPTDPAERAERLLAIAERLNVRPSGFQQIGASIATLPGGGI